MLTLVEKSHTHIAHKMDTPEPKFDFYKLINVAPNATEQEIRSAYRKKALDVHPDRNPGNEEVMKLLTLAKDILLDPSKRQQYDEENDTNASDLASVAGISQSTKTKLLSARFKYKLAKYMTEFGNSDIEDNFKIVHLAIAKLNTELSELINSSSPLLASLSLAQQQQEHSASAVGHLNALKGFFYEGKYISLAKYLIDNASSPSAASAIESLYETLTDGRDNFTGLSIQFQAGLLLLEGQINANKLLHQKSLQLFQKAVILCPIEEVLSAVAILWRVEHLISTTQIVLSQVLKDSASPEQLTHQHNELHKRVAILRTVSRFETSVIQDKETDSWTKALMYIDLSMAALDINSTIQCFILAMAFMLNEMKNACQAVDAHTPKTKKSDKAQLSRLYALCSLICELALTVSVLARKYTLPICELHFNKMALMTMRGAHEILRSKISNVKVGFFKKLFSPRRIKTPLVAEIHLIGYQMIANSIVRLIRVSPLVDLGLSTVSDMFYLDVITSKFAEQFYTTRTSEGTLDENDVTPAHLYQYYLLECAWKRGDEVNQFTTYREKAMKGLLEKNAWSPKEVEHTMKWDALNRDRYGWLDIGRPWLNLPGTNIDSIDGLEVDFEDGTFRLLYTESPVDSGGLLNSDDLNEVMGKGISHAVFSLDPPDSDLPYHPFHQMRYIPETLEETSLLQTMLHADYLLKMISMETEVCATAPHQFRSAFSPNEGFMNLLPDRVREKLKPVGQRRGGNREENMHRFWIEAEGIEMKRTDNEEDEKVQFTFGSCPMQIKTHPLKHNSEGELVDDSEDEEEIDDSEDEEVSNIDKKMPKPKKKRITAETEFANAFTECYDEVGYYFPILLRLRELLKLSTAYAILSGINDSFEEAKDSLTGKLTQRFTENLIQMREKITYPQNTSSNVNQIYRKLLSDQGVNDSALSFSQTAEIKSEIRRQLASADQEGLQQIITGMATAYEIESTNEFGVHVEKWLNSAKRAKELVAYLVEQIYPREYARLNRFSEYASSIGTTFEKKRRNETEMNKEQQELSSNKSGKCPWVPAAFSRNGPRRVYGGICLYPNIKQVQTLSSNNGNRNFTRRLTGIGGSDSGGLGGGSSGGSNNNNNNNGKQNKSPPIGTRKIGPSDKPVLHFVNHPNRKSAQEAAREAGKGNPPVHHTAHKPGEKPHFHPADRNGEIIKDGSHHNYPK